MSEDQAPNRTTCTSTESARITTPARASTIPSRERRTIWAFTIGSVIILVVVIFAIAAVLRKDLERRGV